MMRTGEAKSAAAGAGGDALARLYARRALIQRVRTPLAELLASELATQTGEWRSPAQRRYAARLETAHRRLRQAERQLDVAADSVDRAISRVRAGF